MKQKPTEPRVTDHAVIRYLERVRGMDIAAIRSEIAAKVARGVALGAKRVTVGGFDYDLSPQGAVCTIVPHTGPGKRTRHGPTRPG